MTETKERVVLVAVQREVCDEQFAQRLAELASLVDTAGGEVVATVTQKRERHDARTVIGKGKVAELVDVVTALSVDTVVVNESLSPSQVRDLQAAVDCAVIDRVQLILDIFALRARSREGSLQVAVAQLEYLLPRLAGQGKNLSRQGAGIGARGPGETKLESDRRYIKKRIQDCKQQLKELAKHRQRAREQRHNSSIFQIGLVGYTNAGKSTLLNRLTAAETYEQDQLFATLDPLTRQMLLCDRYSVTLTDTVGFIQDIPTQLIHAFQSTLEESRGVDLLLHVVDASAPQIETHERTVLSLLRELDMHQIPILTVYNKSDLAPNTFHPTLHPHVVISAFSSADIERLHQAIWQQVQQAFDSYHCTFALGEEQRKHHVQQTTYVLQERFDDADCLYHVWGYRRPERVGLEKEGS